MRGMFDWNDLRAFLAVARDGSTLAAARGLGVNQTTVARRVEALEHALGLKLFERGQTGSRLTEAGATLLPEAERVARAVDGVESQAKAYQRGLTGALRITANEVMGNALTPGLAEFRTLYPHVTVELILTDEVLDLAKGEADVAIRGGRTLADSELISRKFAEIDWGLYCSRDYAARKGVPSTPQDLCDHALIAGDGGLEDLPIMQWVTAHAPDATPLSRSNTITNLLYQAKAGIGIAALPCLTADIHGDLMQCVPPSPEFSTMTWIVTRPDLKDTPRVRAFTDFIVPHFTALRVRLQERARAVRARADME
jgi:DNA-binding transcriptional LysR family regulator